MLSCKAWIKIHNKLLFMIYVAAFLLRIAKYIGFLIWGQRPLQIWCVQNVYKLRIFQASRMTAEQHVGNYRDKFDLLKDWEQPSPLTCQCICDHIPNSRHNIW